MTDGQDQVISGWAVLTGDPVDGVVLYGPFPADHDGADAIDWAADNLPGATWWTAPIHEAD